MRISLAGVGGRMGRALVRELQRQEWHQLSLVAAFQHPQSSLLGLDAGELAGVEKTGVLIGESIEYHDFDLLIDFTQVAPSLANLEYCRTQGKAMVIGTTGFDSDQDALISDAGRDIPIVAAPNMSIGVNLCFHVLQEMAHVMGEQADIEIIETHHRHKLDAPSGTAMKMGQVIAQAMNRDLEDCGVYGRRGVGEARPRDQIGFSTVRAGDVVGEHTVLFATEGERLEITHRASNRQTFAHGALRAAQWLIDQPNGRYDMRNVLNLG